MARLLLCARGLALAHQLLRRQTVQKFGPGIRDFTQAEVRARGDIYAAGGIRAPARSGRE
jgi:hypothetical protein